MKSTLREYSLIAGLIVIAISGYLFFNQNKEDILAYSMDMLGAKLVSLLDNEESRATVAAAFDRFEARVLNNEIPPEQVEFVAANVLNLVNSGARLSQEEAEFVLALKSEPGTSLPSPADVSKPGAPETRTAAARVRLGERLETMFTFVDAVGREDSMATHLLRFETSDAGVRIVADPDLENYFKAGSLDPLKEVLDNQQLVRWQKELKKDAQKQALRFEREEKNLIAIGQMNPAEVARTGASEEIIIDLQDELAAEMNSLNDIKAHSNMSEAERAARIKALASLRRLQSLGLVVHMDSSSISGEINLIVSQALEAAGIADPKGMTRIVVQPDSVAKRHQ